MEKLQNIVTNLELSIDSIKDLIKDVNTRNKADKVECIDYLSEKLEELASLKESFNGVIRVSEHNA